MKEDYLWDRSGEADPEIEKLERALGSLRYHPPAQPLPLPLIAPARFRLSFSPALAAAASLVLLALAGALWLSLGNERLYRVSGPGKPPGPIQIDGGQLARKDSQTPVQAPVKEVTAPESLPAQAVRPSQRFSAERRQLMVKLQDERRELRQRENARQGELAKEQLIKALHIASDKLNTVQKKIQGAQESGPVS